MHTSHLYKLVATPVQAMLSLSKAESALGWGPLLPGSANPLLRFLYCWHVDAHFLPLKNFASTLNQKAVN